jgi:ribosomal protection tetracycline resistance protein
VRAGEIAQLLGLTGVRVGDTLGVPGRRAPSGLFAPPTLETAIVARDPAQKAAMHTGLALLAEQDPFIDLRQDDARQELFVSLYGEVQKEIIEQTLRAEFGVEVEFRDTNTICIERPTGAARAIRRMGKPGNPYLGTVGLRLEPGAIGSGVEVRVEADVTTIPLYVYKTIDEFRDSMDGYVARALQQGLSGWRVTDCLVTMTDSDYTPPSTTAGDFRKLTPLVVADALQQAGTVVCEPIHRFHVEAPADCVSNVLGLLARARAAPEGPTVAGSWFQLDGEIPAAEVSAVQRRLPGLTHGEGVLEVAFDHYRPVVPA